MFKRFRSRRAAPPTASPATAATPAPAAPATPPDINWVTLDAADSPQHPGLIVDLIAKRIDGMTVKGIYTPDEIDRALAHLEQHRDTSVQLTWGSMLGMPLYYIGDVSQDRTPFLDDTDRILPIYEEAFGFDPHQRLVSILRPMSGDYEIEPPAENGRVYNPGNIRYYEPDMGGLRAHAGNEFKGQVGEGAMSHLLTINDYLDHMSYFILLQPSDIGGRLSVFDRLFKDYQEPTGFDTADRDDSHFDDVPALHVVPEPGDLILFGGGWRWHRVDAVHGTRPRITYGGFARLGKDGRTIHMWS